MPLPADIDSRNFARTGWGIVFGRAADSAVRGALAPLCELRRRQAGRLYQQITHVPGEPTRDFWQRYGLTPGAVDPELMPYYLLLVGSPSEIPFGFEYNLNVNHAVGRIHFDNSEDYARYARGVVAAESAAIRLSQQATFFAAENDLGAARLAQSFIEPLVQKLTSESTAWQIDLVRKEMATRKQLGEILSGERAPRLLAVSGHGIRFPPGHENQLRWQGSLVCQDWPGHSRVERGHYFSGDDLANDAHLCGMIAFIFADFSGGTPVMEEFVEGEGKANVLAPEGFVARLPQRLLSCPGGGALAVVARAGRSWIHVAEQPPDQLRAMTLAPFEDTFIRLLHGDTVGHALRPLRRLYTAAAAELVGLLMEMRSGQRISERTLTYLWARQLDARNFIILGDPAVRFPDQ